MFLNKKIYNWMKQNQQPINRDIDQRLSKLENTVNSLNKRINTISDYIQNRLLQELIEADTTYIQKKLKEIKEQIKSTKGKK